MKWVECIEDMGDGSVTTRRFLTTKEADIWLQTKIEGLCADYSEFGVYPLGDLEEVDTDNGYFWTT